MKAQDIFDQVCTHIFTQRKQALKKIYSTILDKIVPNCVYKNEKGLKCAIGGIIPKHLMTPEVAHFEGGVYDLCIAFRAIEKYLGLNNENLLNALQEAHDGDHFWESPERMKTHLKTLGNEFDLDISVLDNLGNERRW